MSERFSLAQDRWGYQCSSGTVLEFAAGLGVRSGPWSTRCRLSPGATGFRDLPHLSSLLTLAAARLWRRRRRGRQEGSASSHTHAEAPPAPAPPSDDFLQERVRDATFRIRNLSAVGAGTGAGFAIGSRLIVTNRHVVEGADPLEVTSWDGRALEVEVAGMAENHDLALLTTSRTLRRPVELASGLVREGDLVRIVGYPLGGQFSLIRGLIVGRVDGRPFEEGSDVLRVKAVVLPGYSGGPILDAQGRVLGVVYAQGVDSRDALAIPASSLAGWLASPRVARFAREQRASDTPNGA